jgi:hypothetical protein
MANEPQTNIEEQLKAYGRKRLEQAGGPFELHPATRRLLLGEVARALGRKAPGGEARPAFWARFWPRLAVISTACAGLALVALVWLEQQRPPSSTTMRADVEGNRAADEKRRSFSYDADRRGAGGVELADRESAVPMVQTGQRERERAIVMNGVELKRADDASGVASREIAAATPAPLMTLAPAPLPGAPPPAAPAAEPAGRGTSLALGSLATKPAATPAKAEADALAAGLETGSKKIDFVAVADNRSGADQKAGIAGGQRFVQTLSQDSYRRNFNSPPPVNVLNSFQMEQVGRQIRITDEDGSTYLGEVYTATEPAVVKAAAAQPALAEPVVQDAQVKRALAKDGAVELRDKAQVQQRLNESLVRVEEASSRTEALEAQPVAPAQFFNFRASGTNRTLNQLVVFDAACQLPTQSVNFANAPQAPQSATAPLEAGKFVPPDQTQAGATLTISGGYQVVPAVVPLHNQILRVQGRAVIGGNREIPIQAVPAAP